MKVLKKGRPQKGWATEAKCTGKGNGFGGCGALLLVEEQDIFQTYVSHMGRDESYYATFICPECGVLTDLGETSILPYRISSKLLTKKEWEKLQKTEKKNETS